MRYVNTLPIKVHILSPRNGLKNKLAPHVDEKRLALSFSKELAELLLLVKQTRPNLIIIDQAPEQALLEIDRYTPLFTLDYIPIALIYDHISPREGAKLLESSFADYISLDTLNEESLFRSCRLLAQSQVKESEVNYLQSSDRLTKVGNREHFSHHLKSRLEHLSDGLSNHLGLITIDLDDFKAFNQRLGHDAGDHVIQTLCNRILSCSINHPLFRIGGDEFAVVIEQPSKSDLDHQISDFLTRLSAVLYSPFVINDIDNLLGTSIGIAIAPEHACDADTLIHSSHLARNKAKKVHGCSYNYFEAGKDYLPQPSSFIEQEIWAAMKAEQFELYYQPKIDLKSGKIIGAEALMRWNHPTNGLVMPDTFIPVSERTGQIVPLGFWAVSQAGKDIKVIQSHCQSFEKLGVNLSFRQFQNDTLAQTIQNIIERDAINTEHLEFELTESAMFSDDQSVRVSIDRLSQLGIEFSLDDFGTGYSSFSLLQKLPVHALKIDRSFVSRIPESADDATIVCTIINLAHNLGKQVIAEGVETQEQLEFLIQNECDQVQGFYYSKPLPLAGFIQLLQSEP